MSTEKKRLYPNGDSIRVQRIGNDDLIPAGALQTFGDGLLRPISADSIGSKPSQFSTDRSFWIKAKR